MVNKILKSTAPVRCFHLTAPVLSGEKHLTSAMDFSTLMGLTKRH